MAELLDPTEIFYTAYEPKMANRFIMYIEGIPSYESVTGRDGYSDFYKKDITFNSLGPVGDKVEEWTLKGAFISAATFGDMDWATEDPVQIELTLKYDYAILQF